MSFGKNFEFMIPDTLAQTRFKKTFVFMIDERFRTYSHLPRQVAYNNNILCRYWQPDEEDVNIFKNVRQS